jgi:NADH dehydrogenase
MNLVVGATGPVGLGGEICRQLRSAGQPVRALVRPTANADRLANLARIGVELVNGDLRNRRSLDEACRGIETVISTASMMVSSQEGDTVENVDGTGQTALVDAANTAGVSSFAYVSFSKHIDQDFPFRNAKRAVERRLQHSRLAYTILRPTFLMEVWLNPIAGFDFRQGRARIYGLGRNLISWISMYDVARFAVMCLGMPLARNATFELGGPEALSPLDAVRIFEEVSGRPFHLEFISEETLAEQQQNASDSLQCSLAGLSRCYAAGDVIDMTAVLRSFPVALTSVRGYARRVLESPAA